jgi:general secretion pathway protein A
MYEAYFGITERPFSLTPDPGYLFMSEKHQAALAHLLYGVRSNGGFVVLTGEVGTGKTTLCRCLLEQLPDNVDLALCLNPRLSDTELLATICDELGIARPAEGASVKDLVDRLNRHLLAGHAAGRDTVLVIDEAQNLAPGVLEQIRLLTNLETAKRKLLQVILIGQPEHNDLLARPELRQLAQRISARYHLAPLAPAETAGLVRHRLQVAGLTQAVFDQGALAELHRQSGGVPRLINLIADRSLLGAYVAETRAVNRKLVRRAAAELRGPARDAAGGGARPRLRRWAAAVLAAFVVAALIVAVQLLRRDGAPTEQVTVAAPAVADMPSPPAPPEPAAFAAATAAPAPALPPVSAPPTHADMLAAGASEETASNALFRLWQRERAALPGGGDCAKAAAAGLACLDGEADLARLAALDRPAILLLAGADGRALPVLLVALAGETARLDIGDRELAASRAELEKMWPGRFRLLWQPPFPAPRLLRQGMRGADIAWLRRRLAALDGDGEGGAEGPRDLYDASLKRRVVAFQRASGLAADGVIGPWTLAMLAAAEAAGPHLSDAVPGAARAER